MRISRLRSAAPCLPWVLLTAALLGACARPPAGDGGDYGLHGSDPSVDLKRRDVLPPPEPASLASVLSTFEVAEGFRIELFAAEPLVSDPVAMTVDAWGRMYVVQLHGYPDRPGTSEVRLLRDDDGDGRPDASVVFAGGLRRPKGIMAWKRGVLVTDAPDILYLEDTDGDGRADRREVVMTGFTDDNPQLGVNNPVYGLDNWIYAAHMDNGSTVSFAGAAGEAVELGRRNVRFRPDTRQVEALSARSQFGHAFDVWGRHFLMNNSNPFYHEVLAARYLERNPSLFASSATQDLSGYGDPPRVHPITPDPDHRLGKAGGVTAASGMVSYGGGAFPEAFQGVLFVGEPVYNVVHAARLEPRGATFVAHRLQQGREFLASTDRWFSPVNLFVGPDGALYVLDFSRRIVEQPKFLTREVLESADVYSGSDRGRIYRVTAEGAAAPAWLNALRLGEAPSAELVRTLAHENRWWRETAQRLLVDRRDPASVGPLAAVVRHGASAEARVHALWTLDGMARLEPDLIARALADEHPRVREHAIRLAERHLPDHPALAERLLALRDEPDARVRFQLLLTLGDLESPTAQAVRDALLFDDVEDPWVQLAALSAAEVDAARLYARARSRLADRETPARRALFQRLGALVGAENDPEVVRQVIRPDAGARSSAWWWTASLKGVAEGLRQGKESVSPYAEERDLLLAAFLRTEAAAERQVLLGLLEVLGLPEGDAWRRAVQQALAVVQDPSGDPLRRAAAIRLLALGDAGAHAALLRRLVDPKEPAVVQAAAVRTLGRLEDDAIGAFLLERWGTMTPSVRSEAVEVLLASEPRIFLLLDAVEAGRVSPTAIPRRRDELLVEHADPAIRKRAQQVLRRRVEDRRDVLRRYGEALRMPGDPTRGQVVFARACAYCHAVGGRGADFGPDMASLQNRPPHWLLEQVLVPDHSISDGYEQWVITLDDGTSATGIIHDETSTTLTLKSQGGGRTTFGRASIARLEQLGASAMPTGLEEQISPREMADLLAYLMTVQTVD